MFTENANQDPSQDTGPTRSDYDAMPPGTGPGQTSGQSGQGQQGFRDGTFPLFPIEMLQQFQFWTMEAWLQLAIAAARFWRSYFEELARFAKQREEIYCEMLAHLRSQDPGGSAGPAPGRPSPGPFWPGNPFAAGNPFGPGGPFGPFGTGGMPAASPMGMGGMPDMYEMMKRFAADRMRSASGASGSGPTPPHPGASESGPTPPSLGAASTEGPTPPSPSSPGKPSGPPPRKP